MSRYHGKNAQFYLQGSGAEAVASVGFTEFTLDMSTDRTDATGFENTNIVVVQGLPKFSGTFSGYWDSSFDTPFEAAEATSARKFYAYPSVLSPGDYWYGTCWIDTAVQVSNTDTVKITGRFDAASNITRKT